MSCDKDRVVLLQVQDGLLLKYIWLKRPLCERNGQGCREILSTPTGKQGKEGKASVGLGQCGAGTKGQDIPERQAWKDAASGKERTRLGCPKGHGQVYPEVEHSTWKAG